MRRRTPTGSKQKSKSIGHYLLGKSIGQGTFGKVKLGTHILTGEKVAIKVLDKHRIVEVADVERVSREILILKRINHHDVVRVCVCVWTAEAFLATRSTRTARATRNSVTLLHTSRRVGRGRERDPASITMGDMARAGLCPPPSPPSPPIRRLG